MKKRRYQGDIPRKSLIFRSWANNKYSTIVHEWNSLPIKLCLGICLWMNLFTNSVTFCTKSWMILVSLPRNIYYFSWWCYQNHCSLMDFKLDKYLPLTTFLSFKTNPWCYLQGLFYTSKSFTVAWWFLLISESLMYLIHDSQLSCLQSCSIF